MQQPSNNITTMISDTILNILLNVVFTSKEMHTLNVINLTMKCNSSYIVTVSIYSYCSALSIVIPDSATWRLHYIAAQKIIINNNNNK